MSNLAKYTRDIGKQNRNQHWRGDLTTPVLILSTYSDLKCYILHIGSESSRNTTYSIGVLEHLELRCGSEPWEAFRYLFQGIDTVLAMCFNLVAMGDWNLLGRASGCSLAH